MKPAMSCKEYGHNDATFAGPKSSARANLASSAKSARGPEFLAEGVVVQNGPSVPIVDQGAGDQDADAAGQRG